MSVAGPPRGLAAVGDALPIVTRYWYRGGRGHLDLRQHRWTREPQ